MESPLIRGFDNLVEGGGFVLTVPLKNMGILAGILYMEKESEFEADIIERVKFLYSLVDPKSKFLPQKEEEQTLDMEENLTTREREILEQVGKGMSNSQISDTLFIAEGTVRNHLSKIYSKLKVESRVQAVITGKEKNII
jgi:DNA-binding NarL/FixJ family response regulator